VTVSKNGQLPEDGQVRPKHVVVDCDFNIILNQREIIKTAALKTEMNV
jgi:3-phosphoglycerate kinase